MIVIYFQSFHGSFRFASVRPISFLLNFVSTNTLLGGDSVSGVLPNFTRNSWRPVAFCHIFDEIKMLFLVKRQSQVMHRHQIHGLIFFCLSSSLLVKKDITFFCWRFSRNCRLQCFDKTLHCRSWLKFGLKHTIFSFVQNWNFDRPIVRILIFAHFLRVSVCCSLSRHYLFVPLKCTSTIKHLCRSCSMFIFLTISC